MSNKPEKKQTGKVNYIWVLAGGYLIYLAYKLFRTYMSERVDNPAVTLGAGVLFVVIGAAVLWREWKAYKFGLEHIDDPDSWSDEEDDEEDHELKELMENSKQMIPENVDHEESAQEDQQ